MRSAGAASWTSRRVSDRKCRRHWLRYGSDHDYGMLLALAAIFNMLNRLGLGDVAW